MSGVKQVIKYAVVVLALWISAQTYSWVNFVTPLKGYQVLSQAACPQPRSGVQRILIFSPHEDDETLATGGTIYTELQKGNQVLVVFMTNGDGFWGGEIVVKADLFRQARDFIGLGQIRQREAIKAVATLGLPNKDVLFLGYPDGGLKNLLSANWTSNELYHSPYTRRESSPYANSYRPHAPFYGAALLSDIEAIISNYRPTVIYLPDPQDRHPDHRATGVFVLRALRALQTKRPKFISSIELRSYIVHLARTTWPQPRGFHPSLSLTPPPQLVNEGPWVNFPLSAKAIQEKEAALRAYRTQMSVMGGFLISFVRRSEVYRRIDLQRDFLVPTGGQRVPTNG